MILAKPDNTIKANGKSFRRLSLVRSEEEHQVMHRQNKLGMESNRSTLGKASAKLARRKSGRGERF